MKKTLISVLILSLLMFLFAGCAGDATTRPNETAQTSEEKEEYTVGILQQMEHVALDDANQGFRDELEKLMTDAGKKVNFENDNANGDSTTMSSIANSLVAQECDLILAIATTAATTLKGADQDAQIPCLFTAVTDPTDPSNQLVDSMDNPGSYMTGTSDLNPVEQQLELIQMLVPGIQKLGIIYTTGEPNSVTQYELLEQNCKNVGIELVARGINDAADISAALTAINNEGVEALYLPTDNLLANAAAAVHNYNKEGAKLPVVCGEEGMNSQCGVATYSINYYNLGAQTAQMAFDILVNGKDPATMPVQYYSQASELSVNQAIADELGFTIPEEVLALLED